MTTAFGSAHAAMRAMLVIGLLVAGACDSATAPPKAASIVFLGLGNQSGIVGQQMGSDLEIEIRDATGAPLSGIAFTVTADNGGTVTGAPQKTTTGVTSLGVWTLGTTTGSQSLTVASAGVPSLVITAAVSAGEPASASAGVPTTSSGTVGAISVSQPQIRLADAFGNPVVNLAVNVQVTGGGSVQNVNPTTNSAGIALVGAWTLGTAAGTQRVTLSVPGALAPVIFTATVEAGPAVGAAAASATEGTGMPGGLSSISPSIRVVDAFGNGIGGVNITVAVGGQSGTVSNPSPSTDASGIASVGLWNLSSVSGAQTLTMTAPGMAPVVFTTSVGAPSAFNIVVRTIGSVSPVVQSAVATAVARLQSIIVGDLPDQPIFANIEGCIPGGGTINETVDDLVIYVSQQQLSPTTLAQAGFCIPMRTAAPFHPFIGFLQVNTTQLPLITSNTAYAVAIMTHELLHSVGLGLLWEPLGPSLQNLLQGVGTGTPTFFGAQGFAAYKLAGGSSLIGVPVEGQGGGGTQNSHWRETSLQTELMTGFAELPGVFMPLSRITIASLADLGYEVSFSSVDTYGVPGGNGPPATGGLQTRGASLLNDIVRPKAMLDSLGRPMTVAPPARKRH